MIGRSRVFRLSLVLVCPFFLSSACHIWCVMENRTRKFNSNRMCSVPQCSNRAVNRKISLHTFPFDAALKEEWCVRLRIYKPVTPAMKVCSAHFVASDFFWGTIEPHVWEPCVKRLKKNAMPSQCLPPDTQYKIRSSRQKASPQVQKSGDVDTLTRVSPDSAVAAADITPREEEVAGVFHQLRPARKTRKDLRKNGIQPTQKGTSASKRRSHPVKKCKKLDLAHQASTVARNRRKRAVSTAKATSKRIHTFAARKHALGCRTRAVQTCMMTSSVGVQASLRRVQHSHVQTDNRRLLLVSHARAHHLDRSLKSF